VQAEETLESGVKLSCFSAMMTMKQASQKLCLIALEIFSLLHMH